LIWLNYRAPIRSVFARRRRREVRIDAASTTWLSIPSDCSTVDPEAVQTGLLDDDNREVQAGGCLQASSPPEWVGQQPHIKTDEMRHQIAPSSMPEAKPTSIQSSSQKGMHAHYPS